MLYTRDINSLFLQDTWEMSDSMQLIFGLRYDWYESRRFTDLKTRTT